MTTGTGDDDDDEGELFVWLFPVYRAFTYTGVI